MTKFEKVDELVTIMTQRAGKSGAIGYLTALLASYADDKTLDFHLSCQRDALAEEQVL